MHQKEIDLLINDGMILTIDSKMTAINQGWIAIDKGKIINIGATENFAEKYQPRQKINASGKIVMPGLINTHTHIPMSYFKGIADDLPLHTWLSKHIWPRESKMINDEFIYHSSLHGMAELIKNGTVMFNDSYFRGKQIAKAAIEAGVKGIIGEGILDFPVAGYEGSNMIIDYFLSLVDQFTGNDLIDIALAPHSIYTCEKNTLRRVVELASQKDVLLHIHLAETKKEYEDCKSQHNKTPVAYLNDLNFLSEKCLAAHCVWLDDKDIDILAAKNVNISVNTNSNLKLASGFLPLKKCVAKKINTTLGTDGVASNNNLSLLEEMSITAKVHKALNNDPTFLPAFDAVKMPTVNAAKALGKAQQMGSLEIGKSADVIIVETESIESLPIYDPYSHLVYNLNSSHINDVIINGKPVMFNRQLLTLDEEEIISRAHYYKSKMLES